MIENKFISACEVTLLKKWAYKRNVSQELVYKERDNYGNISAYNLRNIPVISSRFSTSRNPPQIRDEVDISGRFH
jgi:hypothetical protein